VSRPAATGYGPSGVGALPAHLNREVGQTLDAGREPGPLRMSVGVEARPAPRSGARPGARRGRELPIRGSGGDARTDEPRPNRVLRICIATREYRPVNGGGGIGSMMASLATEWRGEGHEVTVLTVDAGGDQTLDGVEIVDVPEYRPQAIWWPLTFARVLRRRGPFDVVFAPEYDGCMVLYALRQTSGPLVTTLATSHEQVAIVSEWTRGSCKQRSRLRYMGFIEKLQAARSAAVIAPSTAMLEWDLRNGWPLPPSRHVIGNPVDVDVVAAAARGPRPGWLSAGPTIAFVGRVERLKGARELFEAMPAIRARFPTAQLVMIGEVLQGLEAEARTVQGVTLTGRMSLAEVAAALGNADVAVFPSFWESFGIAAVEAMAAGAPTVLTSGNGFEAFAAHEENALVVSPGDATALAEAVLRLLGDNELRSRLAAAGRETAAQFAASRIAGRYIEAFDDVLARRGAVPAMTS
jgi:glycosyltransferase involved in cell wall biosynthesis